MNITMTLEKKTSFLGPQLITLGNPKNGGKVVSLMVGRSFVDGMETITWIDPVFRAGNGVDYLVLSDLPGLARGRRQVMFLVEVFGHRGHVKTSQTTVGTDVFLTDLRD